MWLWVLCWLHDAASAAVAGQDDWEHEPGHSPGQTDNFTDHVHKYLSGQGHQGHLLTANLPTVSAYKLCADLLFSEMVFWIVGWRIACQVSFIPIEACLCDILSRK